jgi:O-antigen ligase
MFVAVMLFSAFPVRAESLRVCLNGMIVSAIGLSAVVTANGTGYVLGLHKNGTGPSLAIGLIIAIELWFASRGRSQRWLYVLAAAAIAPGLIITLSRGAWLAAAVGIGVLTAMRRQYGLLVKLAIVLVPLIAFGWSTLPKDSREYATDIRQDRYNIRARYDNLEVAHRFFQQSPLYGSGVGIRKEYDATNIVWFTLAETGALGLVTFALVNLVFVFMVWSAARRISRDDPLFPVLAVGAALVIGTLARGMVDHYWQRGPAFAAWAAAGMAVAVYARSRAPRATPVREP